MDWSARRVTVMGLGRFGGGVGVTRWLASRGARVLVTDLARAETLSEPLAEIDDLVRAGQVQLRLGEHRPEDFSGADVVIANPAVPRPWENTYLRAAADAGVPITTEIALTIRRVVELVGRERTIGITGSVGKSTTTAMIAHALRSVTGPNDTASDHARNASAHHGAASVLMGGNIGGSLLGELDALEALRRDAGGGPAESAPHVETQPPWVVLELSSAMLHWLEEERPALAWSPRVAVVTNIAANHMDWHVTFEHYTLSKQHLLRHQRAGDAAILGSSVSEWASPGGVERVVVWDDRALAGPLPVPGAHNRLNACVALEACVRALGPERREDLARALTTFGGLEHRLEFVGERDGVRFYNDSKCTTPEAMLRALDALESAGISRRNIHLLAGGYDKKIDLAPIAAAAQNLGGLHCLGATGPMIAELARARGVVRVTLSTTLAEAVARARGAMRPGDCLLLSPASASWDQYPNYEHRGDEFKRLVLA